MSVSRPGMEFLGMGKNLPILYAQSGELSLSSRKGMEFPLAFNK
ncbi:hypothetical protein [Tolypothrix sp. FACHB-123]|nr:hypothetical protein [Tolypothrix sp. FACHB-123]